MDDPRPPTVPPTLAAASAGGGEREAQVRTESILAHVTDTYILFDRQWHYLYVNDAAARAIGRPREQIVGRTLWEVFPDIVGTELDRQYHRAMDERVAVAFDFHYSTRDTWWENRFHPTPEGLAVFATDIIMRKRAEEGLRRAHDALEQRVIERTSQLLALNEELRQEERSETCVYVCTLCWQMADPTPLF